MDVTDRTKLQRALVPTLFSNVPVRRQRQLMHSNMCVVVADTVKWVSL